MHGGPSCIQRLSRADGDGRDRRGRVDPA